MSHDVYIASCGSWLPEKLTPVQEGLASGEYSEKDFESMGYESIAIGPESQSAPFMGLAASKTAISNAGIQGDNLSILTFNGVHRHGNPQLWCPASYLQHQLHAEEALPFSIYQGCNGQLLSIALITAFLQTSIKPYALSVTADQYSLGGINRWHGDYGIVYGDAAAAMVLSRTKGIAKIISLHTYSDPSLEGLHRFDESLHASDSFLKEKYYNVRATKKAFLKRYGKETVMQATKKAMATLWEKTFSENQLMPDDICYFIFPNLSEEVLDANYFSVYPSAKEKSLWHFGRKLGHLSAADVGVALDYVFKNNLLKAGEKVLCIGAGSGFSWSTMVIEKT